MSTKTVKIPKKALNLDLGAEHAEFKFGRDGEEKRTLSMTAYSGGIIPDHWYWGNLVIDLQGMSFKKGNLPLFYRHDTERPIGFAQKPVVDKSLRFENATLLSNDDAQRIISLSDEGFPLEASIRAEPKKIRFLKDNETINVNGFEFKGPGTVWLKSVFKEASVCPFGYDPNTSSKAFEEGDLDTDAEIEGTRQFSVPEQPGHHQEEGQQMPTIEEFKKSDPQGFSALRSEIEKEFQGKLDDAEAAAKKFSVANDALKSQFEEQGKQIVALQTQFQESQKAVALQEAKATLTKAFEESKVPDTAIQKAVDLFNFSKFFTDGGTFDQTAFSAAVPVEIESWEKMFEGVTVVKGGGATGSFSKTIEDTPANKTAFAADCSAAKARMLKHLGVAEPKSQE